MCVHACTHVRVLVCMCVCTVIVYVCAQLVCMCVHALVCVLCMFCAALVCVHTCVYVSICMRVYLYNGGFLQMWYSKRMLH